MRETQAGRFGGTSLDSSPRWRTCLRSVSAGLLAVGISSGSMAGSGDCVADITGDGRVDGADLAELLGGWNDAGASDLNGDGNTNGADLSLLLGNWGECPEPTLEVTLAAGSDAAFLVAGGDASIPFEVVVSGSTEAISIVVVQSVSSDGLTVSNDLLDGVLSAASDGTYVFNTSLSGSVAGEYTVSTQASWEGGVASLDLPVSVLPPPEVPVVSPLSADPGAINAGKTTDVAFSVAVTGTSSPPVGFEIRRTDAEGIPIGGVVGELRDDGASPDLVAGDGVFSGLTAVSPDVSETVRYFRAFEIVGVAGGGLETGVLALPVTPFPVGTSPSDPDSVVEAPGGTLIYSDQIFVTFVAGTTDARVEEVAGDFDGEIVGYVPATGGYQMAIPGDGSANGVLNTIAAMKTVVDVDVAEPILPITITELVPNDPLYPTQVGVRALRSAEAWTAARQRLLEIGLACAEAAACFEAGVSVQRNRLARREQTATNEDAMLAHLLEQAEAMRAVVEGWGMPPSGSPPSGSEP